MNIESLYDICSSLPNVKETMPFGNDNLVFKLADKIFAIINLDSTEHYITLKINPEESINLQDRYNGIYPGYHMNKMHWATINIESDIPDEIIKDLVIKSYKLVKKNFRFDREKC